MDGLAERLYTTVGSAAFTLNRIQGIIVISRVLSRKLHGQSRSSDLNALTHPHDADEWNPAFPSILSSKLVDRGVRDLRFPLIRGDGVVPLVPIGSLL
jgi:hypothetical protein